MGSYNDKVVRESDIDIVVEVEIFQIKGFYQANFLPICKKFNLPLITWKN